MAASCEGLALLEDAEVAGAVRVPEAGDPALVLGAEVAPEESVPAVLAVLAAGEWPKAWGAPGSPPETAVAMLAAMTTAAAAAPTITQCRRLLFAIMISGPVTGCPSLPSPGLRRLADPVGDRERPGGRRRRRAPAEKGARLRAFIVPWFGVFGGTTPILEPGRLAPPVSSRNARRR